MLVRVLTRVLCLFLPVFLCRCVTTESAKAPPIIVEGTMFYPDEHNVTYIIPAGAEIIGAGGDHCTFIVERGGKLTAHTGTNNTYEISDGGEFQGFDHAASDCKVIFQPGAEVSQLECGHNVFFAEKP